MLNRLFIVVVSLVILAIIAGFVAPFFVDWSQYKDRLEAIASEALGQEVHVAGDFSVRLLPQPRMQFDDVLVGPEAGPLIEVASVEAELSLADFLRDHYTVTRLVLQQPRLTLAVGADGRVANLLQLPEQINSGTVSVADAEIVDGALRLRDARSSSKIDVSSYSGQLQMSGLRGPFALQGSFEFNGQIYEGRVTSSALNDAGALQLNGFMQRRDLGFSVEIAGLAETSGRMGFEGAAEIRFAQEDSESAAGVRGDVVLASELTADADRVDISEFVLLPDENRPATRLSGSATINLGADPRFDVVARGGVVALAARNALVDENDDQYALVNLLNELPAPLVPTIAGHLGLEIAELDARAFVMREVTLDAESTGQGWAINAMTARLPGNTSLSLNGDLTASDNLPAFDGAVELTSGQLSTFAAQWRKPGQSQALLNASGKLRGRIRLVDGAMVFDGGRLTIDDVTNEVGLVVGRGGESLSLNANLGALDVRRSDMLAGLLPEFNITDAPRFDDIAFSVAAEQVSVWGLPATGLVASGNWSNAGLYLDQFSADDWGGAKLDAQVELSGDLAAPIVSGEGAIEVTRRDSALVSRIFDRLEAPEGIGELVARLPLLRGAFDLSEPLNGAQNLALEVAGGAFSFAGEIGLSQGLSKILEAPLTMDMHGAATDAVALETELGLGALPFGRPGQPVQMTLRADGSLLNSVDVDVTVTASGERLQFNGGTILTDLASLRGGGRVAFTLSDAAPMIELLGAGGVGAGPVSGDADIRFGGGRLTLSNISALAAGAQITGDIAREEALGAYVFEGDLEVGRIGVDSLAKVLGGRAALAIEGTVWPEGPFNGSSARTSRGNVGVKAAQLVHGSRTIVSDAEFEIDWDARELRMRDFVGSIGAGRIELDVKFCCEAAILERQITGRAVLEGADLRSVLPDAMVPTLDGKIDAGVQFTGTGASFAELMRAMTGEGSFTVSGLSIRQLEPDAFYTLVDVVDVLEQDEEALESQVRSVLKSGAHDANDFGGLISIAGGTVRVSNVVAEGVEARLIGSTRLSLADLGLDGRWTLTPVDQNDGRVASGGAEVVVQLGGSFLDPDVQLDLTSLIEGVKFEAYGREVARLEALKAEQEARTRAAAEQRARLQAEMAEQLEAQRRAEEEARRREAARRAAEERETERLRLQEQQAVDLFGGAQSN